VSVCTIVAVFTQTRVGIAHIPWGRRTRNGFIGQEVVIDELLAKLVRKFGAAELNGAQGQIHYYQETVTNPDGTTEMKGQGDSTIQYIADYLASYGVNPIGWYPYDTMVQRSGNFVLTYHTFPPSYSFV